MAGGFAGGTPARVRIKGRTASCVRFCLIAVSFMMAWVLITSELGYYSKWMGPQILLELSLAFNVPAIPVLIISGQVEKILDRQLGPVKSMSFRLLFGLAGCTACAAVFPFLPHSTTNTSLAHTSLLWAVAVLGMLSAIAFSTSYQLVQWFRHADIIALGVGGVATGPLVLLLQLCLGVGPHPERWQWIAMFEATALVMSLGLFSATSLFAQYWKVMTGEEEYVDARQPLLSSAEAMEDDQQENRHMRLARATTKHFVMPPDPTAYAVSAMLAPGSGSWPDEDDRGVPRLKSVASAGCLMDLRAGARKRIAKQTYPFLRATTSLPGALPHVAAAHMDGNAPAVGGVLWPGQPAPLASNQDYGQGPAAWHAESCHGLPTPLDTAPLAAEGGGQEQQPCASSPGQQSAFEAPGTVPQDALGRVSHDVQIEVPGTPMTLQQENVAVFKEAWQVLGAFMISVTITYCVFPFFTYVRSTGLVGDELPKVLFFLRIFADLAGRFAPRCKALMVHSPNLLGTMALFKVGLCTLFFVYLKAPARFQHDPVAILFVLVIWVLGGYINTSANIMAPAIVQPCLVGRASALLALIFQVAHFAGLLLAVLLAFVLYGDVVG